jgi:hypothetical protein
MSRGRSGWLWGVVDVCEECEDWEGLGIMPAEFSGSYPVAAGAQSQLEIIMKR